MTFEVTPDLVLHYSSYHLCLWHFAVLLVNMLKCNESQDIIKVFMISFLMSPSITEEVQPSISSVSWLEILKEGTKTK